MGDCPEDCGFCSQSSRFGSPSGEAPILSVDELVDGARRAAAAHAKRYCMVTATRGPSQRDLDVICEVLVVPERDQRVILYTAEPGSPSDQALRLLGVIGTQSMAQG